jgi:thiol:disulfide interchange protein
MTNRYCREVLTVALALWGAAVSGALGQLPAGGVLGGRGAAESKQKSSLTLLADRKAIVPGEPILLGLQFTIDEGWHIYWRNAGASGLPPRVAWELPEGLKAGPLQFPMPGRYPTPVGDTYVHSGRPVLLVKIATPADLTPGQEVTIAGRVNWLVCKESCILQKQDVSLTLPVAKPGDPVEFANEPVFKSAKAKIPARPGQSPDVQVEPKFNVDRVRPGDDIELALALAIVAPGLAGKAWRPADAFPDVAPGLTIGEAVLPKATTERSMGGAMVPLYTRSFAVVLPIHAESDLKGDSVRVSGVLTYQAIASGASEAEAPAAVEWEARLPVAEAGAAVAAANVDVFGGGASERGLSVQLEKAERPIWLWLVLAMVAGLILNVTPCVLPVISIKVLSFVQQAQESPARVLKLGLVFAAGMLAVFNLLAGLATGAGLVWGQHFQDETFVAVMAAVIFAFGLSLFGVFELGVPRSIEEAASRQEREGYVGSFAKGALATVLGTPCLGPVLGSVLTWSVSQPGAVVFLVFNAIGVGMAAPYVVLTANPRWLRFVPKPGPWMETFKHVMGFVLMATVVYLLTIVLGQGGGSGVVWLVAFLLGVGFACWLWGRYVTFNRTAATRWVVRVAAVAIVAGAWLVTMVEPAGPERIAWQPFSRQDGDGGRDRGMVPELQI